ncbi:unnamed protein product [Owenia fusiformis]|uniref:C-mannosyltransferase DPY19L1 n=1 Tax=Owenia fusiformis TaxID=6347 RepID=A0A8S4P4V1_OWEFU|nr:unnamed protein product [Owenia fusiformis]
MAAKRRQQNSAAHENGNKSTSNNNGKVKPSRRKDRGSGDASTGQISKWRQLGIPYLTLVGVLAITCGVLHRNHISFMFESDRHFSHLSSLERELAFRTEMGLYYSYFKTMIGAPTVMDGLNQIMYDNGTEFPLTINTLKRFNLYPEVVVGILFRGFTSITTHFKIHTKTCWNINRGKDLSPVQSCEGIGDPAYFYIEHVFFLNGLMMSCFFLFGTYISGSIFGGLISVCSFFFNHGEATRVQWTPPLRESFAYPFLVIEMLLVTHILKIPRPQLKHSILLAISTMSFMLPWQFAQFCLLTQAVAVFGTYVLQYIGSHKFKVILNGLSLGLVLSYGFLFGNEMLLTSFFAACLVTLHVIVHLEPLLEKLKVRFLIWVAQGGLLLVGTVGIKFLLSKLFMIADDAHIGDIFRSKFTDFKNFHTMLYTCAAEFDFMDKETPGKLTHTLLIPATLISTTALIFHVLKSEYTAWKGSQGEMEGEQEIEVEDIKYRSKPHAELLYNVFQLIGYTAMAIMIMRLKLFWTPQLCLIASLLASRQLFSFIKRQEIHWAILAAVLGLMSIQGISNLQKQWAILGEFSNVPMEEMIEWINTRTPKDAVFAGPMPTTATIKLCTLRPIVNHPHYEDAGLRERTKKVYSMYSRKPAEEVYATLLEMGVDYAVLEESWCVRRTKEGCGMVEIWDLEDVKNRGQPPLCEVLGENPGPYFEPAFKNSVYKILKLKKTKTSQRS